MRLFILRINLVKLTLSEPYSEWLFATGIHTAVESWKAPCLPAKPYRRDEVLLIRLSRPINMANDSHSFMHTFHSGLFEQINTNSNCRMHCTRRQRQRQRRQDCAHLICTTMLYGTPHTQPTPMHSQRKPNTCTRHSHAKCDKTASYIPRCMCVCVFVFGACMQ